MKRQMRAEYCKPPPYQSPVAMHAVTDLLPVECTIAKRHTRKVSPVSQETLCETLSIFSSDRAAVHILHLPSLAGTSEIGAEVVALWD